MITTKTIDIKNYIMTYMKRQSFLALSLVALLGVMSCDNDSAVVTLPANDGVRTVNFLAHMEENVDVVSRTGVRLKVIHTWQDTKTENIHLFETDSQGSILEGTNVAIQTEEPYETASFSANFETVASVQTRAGSGYTYTGIIAQRVEGGKYIIPSVQYPTDVNTGTGIDPDADFIIGKAFENETTLDGKTINFEFKRPVAVSRFAITNIEGSYVKSVTITSNNELTGSASYNDIDFTNCTVSFTGGSKTLTMEFEDNKLPVSSTTYVNFVSTLGEKEITKVEVATDQYIYTKTKTATLTFNANTFKNIAMDMTVKDGVCTREKNIPYYRRLTDDQLIDGKIPEGTYLIVSSNYAFDAKSSNYRTSLTIVDNKIEATETLKSANVEFISNSGKYYLNTAEGYVRAASSSSGSGTKYYSINFNKTESESYLHTVDDISISNKFVSVKLHYGSGSNARYLSYVSSSFRYYSSNSYQTSFELYLLDGSSKTARNLAFAQTSVKKEISEIGTTFSVTLNGKTDGGITYSSSDESVATVANDGTVTIKGEGETTIKAKASENDTYRAGEASFVLTVYDPDDVGYYVLVEKEPASWEGKYLIVSAKSGTAYAFDYSKVNGSGTNWPKSVEGSAVTIEDGKIYSNTTVDKYAVTVSKYGDTHAASSEKLPAYDIKVYSGSYLYRYNSAIFINSSSEQNGRQNQHTLMYDNGVQMMFAGNLSGANIYYFHYTSNAFTYDSGSATDRVYFFKYVGE